MNKQNKKEHPKNLEKILLGSTLLAMQIKNFD
ncbi:hypothetical protein SAMN05421766_1172 [Zobellia uliginosa]|uniref:Uncharacterized protein n=1 Tax=Zobellia uliginosa TaxID=143224 RepID=A0ABY1L284_9FLAO|nr:hypothetical protein SAMN05421766_1172 [Zobellia uliginosa]